jgi:hypothetical protein
MTIVEQQTTQQITDLINACGGYWELRGIPAPRRKEMQLELEQHVEQAVRDGKSLEAVVGPNALAFAENWAREMPHRFSGGFVAILRWIALDWLPYALALVGLLALGDHFLLLSPSFTLTLEKGIVGIGFIGLFTLLQAVTGFFSPRIKSRDNRLLLAFGVYAVVSLLIVLILHVAQVPLNGVLFRWDWPVTLGVILGAGVLLGLKIWSVRGERQMRR